MVVVVMHVRLATLTVRASITERIPPLQSENVGASFQVDKKRAQKPLPSSSQQDPRLRDDVADVPDRAPPTLHHIQVAPA
jgi:hypothetical protein